jgi:hypothetical protein
MGTLYLCKAIAGVETRSYVQPPARSRGKPTATVWGANHAVSTHARTPRVTMYGLVAARRHGHAQPIQVG